MTAEVQRNQPAALYMQEYHYRCNWTMNETDSVCGEDQWTHAGQFDYSYLSGGTADRHESESSCWDNSCNWAYSWPCGQCPVTGVLTDSGGDDDTFQTDLLSTLDFVQAYSIFGYNINIPMAEWNMSQHEAGQGSYSSYMVDETLSIGSQMTYQTGGKGVAGSQNLYEIDVSALKWQPCGVFSPGGSCVPAVYVCSTAIPSGVITDQGQTANARGQIFVGLPADEKVPITPQAPARSDTYTAYPSKIPVMLTANGIDLSTNNPTFCVGQQIRFSLNFSPTLTPSTGIYSWTLPAKFVNVATPISFGCTDYTTDYSLLDTTNNSCTCWYVNGSGGSVSVSALLFMPNGKPVSVAAIGKFTIFRPSLSDFDQQLYDLTWNFPTLRADMSWKMNVDSTFNGQYGITQLLLGTGIYYGTGGQYVLDGNSPIYGEIGTNGPVPYYTNDPGSQALRFLDSPSAPTTSLNLTFKDYLRFQPSGNNSIFVTLATNGWSVNASVNPLTGTLTPTNIPPAIQPVDSDEFPVWYAYRSGH
jgi:hypothetical protein